MRTVWNAFMPIPAKSANALGVLRLVRRRVLPLVQRMRGWRSYSFLIHDRASGVPVLKSDKRAYIHLRLTLGMVPGTREDYTRASMRRLLPKAWTIIRQVRPTEDETRVHDLLDEQCCWYLNLVESGRDLDDEALLQKIGRHLHYFANMAQMSVR